MAARESPDKAEERGFEVSSFFTSSSHSHLLAASLSAVLENPSLQVLAQRKWMFHMRHVKHAILRFGVNPPKARLPEFIPTAFDYRQ